jgi:hypothetical protein
VALVKILAVIAVRAVVAVMCQPALENASTEVWGGEEASEKSEVQSTNDGACGLWVRLQASVKHV